MKHFSFHRKYYFFQIDHLILLILNWIFIEIQKCLLLVCRSLGLTLDLNVINKSRLFNELRTKQLCWHRSKRSSELHDVIKMRRWNNNKGFNYVAALRLKINSDIRNSLLISHGYLSTLLKLSKFPQLLLEAHSVYNPLRWILSRHFPNRHPYREEMRDEIETDRMSWVGTPFV